MRLGLLGLLAISVLLTAALISLCSAQAPTDLIFKGWAARHFGGSIAHDGLGRKLKWSEHGPHPSWYIADIAAPLRYQSWPGIPPNGDGPRAGFDVLGGAIDFEQHVWETSWFATALWLSNQMQLSPLRTHDAEHADFVWVPVMIFYEARCLKFMDTAADTLPLLSQKPHLLATAFPMSIFPACMSHPSALNFTFVTSDAWSDLLNWTEQMTSLYIGCPLVGHVHWHAGSAEFQGAIQQPNKTRLIFQSFAKRNVRLYSTPDIVSDRFGLADQCTQAKDEMCKHMDFSGMQDKKHAIVSSLEGYKSAWYVAMPQGDYMVRVSFWDVLVSGAIPVVFNATFYQHLPFSDVVPYHDFMIHVHYAATLEPGAPSYVDMVHQQHNETAALLKIGQIAKLAHLFQYSLNPEHTLITFDARAIIHARDDAFTTTLKAALRNLCARGMLPKC